MIIEDLEFALGLADIADAVTMAWFRSAELQVETKPDHTAVTVADRETEQAIRTEIQRACPGDGVLGEEFGGDASARRWIIDPIDGTSSFLRGVPVWATLLALELEGRVEVAVASAPALQRRWWAVRGAGAWVDGTPIRVSQVATIEDALVSTTSQRRMPPGWIEVVRRAWANRGFGDFWHHCLTAEGSVDVATDGANMRIWDYSAPKLIVEEAGGRCTTFEGAEPTDGCSLLSTNAALHDEMLVLLS